MVKGFFDSQCRTSMQVLTHGVKWSEYWCWHVICCLNFTPVAMSLCEVCINSDNWCKQPFLCYRMQKFWRTMWRFCRRQNNFISVLAENFLTLQLMFLLLGMKILLTVVFTNKFCNYGVLYCLVISTTK